MVTYVGYLRDTELDVGGIVYVLDRTLWSFISSPIMAFVLVLILTWLVKEET